MSVAIVGVGQTPFSRNCGVSIRELCFEAFREALEDLNLTSKEIDASIICSAPEYDKQRSPAGLISEYLGLTPKPTFYAESICSSSSTGVKVGYSFIKSGLHEIVAVIGFQKMSEISSAEVQERMGRGADTQWESPFGTMMPAGYAMYARAHMQKYGTTEEQLAKIKVKSGKYALLNPLAIFRREITLEECLKARVIASPLKMYDCCANADGASCVIMASEEKARKTTDTPVWVAGIGAASDTLSTTGRSNLTGLTCAVDAAKQAYQMAHLEPKDVDVAEVHDCFTIAEIMAYENLGFCKPSEGGKLIEESQTYIGGKIPVNVDGGLLSKGHPIGATGGSQIRTIVLQLQGRAGKTQVKGAEVGLVHNIGGIGVYGNVTLLRR
ncbi:MAG: thiolase domain-containing protein [Candidatus Bathyarchaeota archaeon]|nr:thiolase domain-containing protein [Candidatus Bathyarchaeota archaeon]MDH5786836.1 thiolase domain-containing protein [Candidatus Bathyarchaeota archaeon]